MSVLLLAGAVVVIDIVCPETITKVLRRNRGEALIGVLWLAVHIMKDETK